MKSTRSVAGLGSTARRLHRAFIPLLVAVPLVAGLAWTAAAAEPGPASAGIQRGPALLAGQVEDAILEEVRTPWDAYLQRRSLERTAPIPENPPWFSLGPSNIAGRILSIAFDPRDSRVIYAGSAGGGPWKSTDGGLSWRPIGDNLPSLAVGAIAVAPHHPNIVLLGTGDPSITANAIYGVGILRSTDGGATWNPTNLSIQPDSSRGGFAAISANVVTGVLLAAGREGLFRSSDDGSTWTRIDSTGYWTDVTWRPGSSDTAYAVRERGGIYRSEDGGASFGHLGSGLPPDDNIIGFSRIAVSASHPDTVYAGLCSSASHGIMIYRSTDAGTTWALRTQPDLYDEYGPFANVLLVDPADPNRLYAGSFDLWSSDDGGASWSRTGYEVYGFHSLALIPGSGSLWAGTDTGVFESGNLGSNWTSHNAGLVTTEFYSVCMPRGSKSVAYAGGWTSTTLRYTGTPAWEEAAYASLVCLCDPDDPLHVYGWSPFQYHFVSWDGIQTAAIIDTGLTGESRWVAPFDMDPNDPQRIFTATKNAIYRSANGGVFWQEVLPAFDVVSISVSPVNGRWIWALDRADGKVRYSSNGGDTWSSVQAAPFAGIGGTKILADPVDTLVAYCTFLSHPLHPPLVLRTYNGGASWQDMTGNLQGQSVNTIAVDPDSPRNWYVGTGVGVWEGSGILWSPFGSGASWRPYGRGLPYALTLDLAIHRKAGKLRAATHGRGVWEVALLRTDAALDRNPASLLLEHASANPGKGSVLFRYSGRGRGPLELRVFTVTGRLVTRLAVDPPDGFVRTATWDTRSVRAGIYFAVLESGGSRVSRKVVVIR